jgi:hypothetical protein
MRVFCLRRKKEIEETKEKKRKEKKRKRRAKMEEKCLKWHVTGTCTVDRLF